MRLIKFLSLLEKIIILLIILCFIPTALFAYLPHPITTSQQLQSAYQNVVEQASHSGFLTTTASGNNCSSQFALVVNNQLCLDRCVIGSSCSILQTAYCPYAYNYVTQQVKVCTAAPVLNKYIPADTVAFEADHTSLPLHRVTMDDTMRLQFQPYCLSNLDQCRQLIGEFGREDLEERFTDNYKSFTIVVRYLMFFGLFPLIVHTVTVFLLDSCGKFNLRLTNSLMIIHEALIGAGIIIAGISFNLQNDAISSSINRFASSCLINHPQCHPTYLPFSTFTQDDGVSSTFVTIMCFVLAIEALLLVGVVILNVLMVKYYKLRELQPSFSGYELQTL